MRVLYKSGESGSDDAPVGMLSGDWCGPASLIVSSGGVRGANEPRLSRLRVPSREGTRLLELGLVGSLSLPESCWLVVGVLSFAGGLMLRLLRLDDALLLICVDTLDS